jgi:hypothetical protein
MNALTSICSNINQKEYSSSKVVQKKKDSSTSAEKSNTAVPSCEVLQAVYNVSLQNSQSDKLINKFALTGKLGVSDIANLKKIIKSGNAQAENISMLLRLVDKKTVNPKTLKFVCKDGLMSDGMEKDIKMIYEAEQKGIKVEDAYIPQYANSDEAAEQVQIGDLFEVEGQQNIYIKNKDGKPEQLKMNKEMMIKLFPPAERFANAQTYSADCYFVSSINAMIDNPKSRAYFLQCFEQDGDNVKITFPSNDFSYTAENAEMPKTYKANYVTGSTGMKLVEYAYGKYLENYAKEQAFDIQNEEIEKLKNQLAETTDNSQKKELQKKIVSYSSTLENLKANLSDKSKAKDIIIELDTERKPVILENSGISVRSLQQMNTYRQTSYQSAGDYYRCDGGYMEDVFKDFGFEETHAYSIDDEEIQKILTNPDLSQNYIFSGGTRNKGKQNPFRKELIMNKNLSMYGLHAYRIAPSIDNNGQTIFKVSNPWNSSQNTVLTMEQLKEYFCEIHTAKIQ